MSMLPDKDTMCHHTAFEKSCFKMVTECRCRKWVLVQGNNPNTGEPVNRYDCADAWAPFLQIETSQQVRQAGASIDQLRNTVDEGNRGGHVVRELISERERVNGPRAIPHTGKAEDAGS
jgi:hypothetical protein